MSTTRKPAKKPAKPALTEAQLGKIRKIGKVSSLSVLKGTGKNWDQWISLLDKVSAKSWPHREIVMLLKKKYKVSPWWQQGVSIAYELHHGLRVEGRNARGEYSMTATRTLPIASQAAWQLLTSETGMNAWLRPFSPFSWKPGQSFEVDGGIFGEIRTMKAGVRARLTWQEAHWEKPSVVQIYIVPRKGGKCVLVIQHEKIPSAALKGKMREQWKVALDKFSAVI